MSVDGKLERVTPGDIKTTAVMTVEGELDDISGSGQTRAALAMCSGVDESDKKHLEAKGAGHYGIFSGRRWRDVVYPAVQAFILEKNQSLNEAAPAPIAVTQPVTPVIAQAPEATVAAALESPNKAALAAPDTVVAKARSSEVERAGSVAKKVEKASATAKPQPVTKPVLVAVASKDTGTSASKQKPVPPEKSAA